MTRDVVAQVPIGDTFGSPFGRSQGIADLVAIVLSNALVISGVILLAMMIGGGLMMVAGAGQNKPDMGAKGKTAVTSAAIGFVIIFVSFWLIKLVEIVFGFSILTPDVPGVS